LLSTSKTDTLKFGSGIGVLFQDSKGNYWFGTSNGLSKYSGNRFNTYTTDDGISNNNITSVYCESENKLWFGTLAGGVSYFDGTLFKNYGIKDGLISLTIRSIIKDANENFWTQIQTQIQRWKRNELIRIKP